MVNSNSAGLTPICEGRVSLEATSLHKLLEGLCQPGVQLSTIKRMLGLMPDTLRKQLHCEDEASVTIFNLVTAREDVLADIYILINRVIVFKHLAKVQIIITKS